MNLDTSRANTAFQNIYPDIDPTTPIPVSIGERIATTVSAAVLAYGAATGDLIIMGAGLAFVLFALIAPASNIRRKVRREARTRFPNENWAETELNKMIRTDIYVPLFWLFIAACSLGLFYFTPSAFTMWGGIVAAVIAAIVSWLMPGLSPIWLRKFSNNDEQTDLNSTIDNGFSSFKAAPDSTSTASGMPTIPPVTSATRSSTFQPPRRASSSVSLNTTEMNLDGIDKKE